MEEPGPGETGFHRGSGSAAAAAVVGGGPSQGLKWGAYRMKTIALILLPLLRAAAAAPADIDALIESARAAPAEFAADAMIRIAGTDKIEQARKIELLEQAFQRASGAQEPYQRHGLPLRLNGSTAYRNRVYQQGLDALSLRLGAVADTKFAVTEPSDERRAPR